MEALLVQLVMTGGPMAVIGGIILTVVVTKLKGIDRRLEKLENGVVSTKVCDAKHEQVERLIDRVNGMLTQRHIPARED